MQDKYEVGLERCDANFQPLTPLQFLERAAAVFPERTAIIHGALRRNYRHFYPRRRQLASALPRHRIKRGPTVSVILPTVPATL